MKIVPKKKAELTQSTQSTAPAISVSHTIEIIPIDRINLWKDNPRKNDRAVPKLAEIIKARGQITPVVVWVKNYTAYKGNTTIKALKSLGEKHVKVLFADFPSEDSAIAYGIADNRASEFAGWDDDLLKAFMTNEVVTIDNAQSIGYSHEEFEKIMRGNAPEDFKDIDPNVDTAHSCPKCGYKWN